MPGGGTEKGDAAVAVMKVVLEPMIGGLVTGMSQILKGKTEVKVEHGSTHEHE